MRDIITKILKEETPGGGDIDKRYNQPLEEGDIIELIYMDDPYNPISPLTRGIVRGFERVPGGEDKILVTWIVDPENDKLFNMPMIPEVDVWMKLDVDPPTMHTPTGRDSRTTIGNPLRLREQGDVTPGVPVETTYSSERKEHVPMAIPSKTLFFKVVKQIVETNPGNVLEYDDTNTEDRAYEMDSVLKLFGMDSNYFALTNKIFWAAYDNRTGIEDGSINSFDELNLRPYKEYRVECYETAVEHVTYQWEPIVEAYSSDDAANLVIMDDDGYYAYWEWDNQPGYNKDYGDMDSDGKEIEQVTEIGPVNESRVIKENESPEENELIDGLRDILHKQKEAHSEDRWYDDIEKLLKRLNIPLHEGFVSHSYEPVIGDNVKNNNPGCIHYGSEGVIEDIEDLPDDVGKTITYRVTNDGENYENGDMLTKTMDQLISLQDHTSTSTSDEKKLTEIDARILIHKILREEVSDDAIRRLRIVFSQMKTIKEIDEYITAINKEKKQPYAFGDMRTAILGILKLVGRSEERYDTGDLSYWFAKAFLLNGGYGRDFKEGEIQLVELPVYGMEANYTEEVFEYRSGWGDIIGVTSEEEAIEIFESNPEGYIEDSDTGDSDYGDIYDVSDVVVNETRWIKFKPAWVGLG